MWTVTICLLLVLFRISPISNNQFAKKDIGLENIHYQINTLLQDDFDMMLGSELVLSDNEQRANDTIMKLKLEELDHGFSHPGTFNYSKHFFDYKDEVKNTPLYKIIKRMPKGAVLHAHDTAILSPDYVVELTYWDDLFICYEGENIQFMFALRAPKAPCKTKWELMKEVRYASRNITEFDATLRKHFTLLVKNPTDVYTDVNIVWNHFQNYFITTSGLMCFKPLWEQYFYDSFKAFKEDNVMYVEIRSVLPHLYDLDGNVYYSVAVAESIKKVLDRFTQDYPDFFGAKLIYAPLRQVNTKSVVQYIEIAKVLKEKLPDFFAGFDLVGQEDLGAPLRTFLPILHKAAEDLNYFFHAGETSWYGTSSDENLIDAIVLNSKRIGHGFALTKHPALMKEVKTRGIGIEVNVISNVVLKLVDDIRNHPLAVFLAYDLPVVLSSDDPGVWEADPLSHDFYVAFVGVASRRADLRLLKKLALNSLYFSTYQNVDKMVYEFEKRWTKFIDNGQFEDLRPFS